MFAATALGKIHNEEAGKILIDAARSETEWRVQVNIFNAIGKLPRYSSAIHAVLKKAVSESLRDSITSNHVARTALDVLDQMIAAGKVSSPDSISIREWLLDYEPSHEQFEDQSLRVRSQCMIPLARLGADEETIKQICSYLPYNERTIELNIMKAIGLVPDTLAFYRLLARALTSPTNILYYVLDGLHSNWELAKKDTGYMRELENIRYASMYRHMLIRYASQTEDPGIVVTTLDHIKDPLIITDSLRSEAEEYLLQYLNNFAYPKYHDHLTAIFSAVAWLKPKNDTVRMRIQKIHDLALTEWGDGPLADSADIALIALGAIHEKHWHDPKLVREPIDWKTIEMAARYDGNFNTIRIDVHENEDL